VSDVIDYCKIRNMAGILLLVDIKNIQYSNLESLIQNIENKSTYGKYSENGIKLYTTIYEAQLPYELVYFFIFQYLVRCKAGSYYTCLFILNSYRDVGNLRQK
jgi:hypothetical protein